MVLLFLCSACRLDSVSEFVACRDDLVVVVVVVAIVRDEPIESACTSYNVDRFELRHFGSFQHRLPDAAHL